MLEHIIIFLYSIAFSFVISIPIGGVNMAVFQATLNDSRRSGYMIGFGAILAEAVYCAIPMFGLNPYLEKWGLMDYLYYLFIPVLLFMGIATIYKSLKEMKAGEVKDVNSDTGPKAHRRSMSGYFLYGFILCASNPMTFVFWLQAVVLLRKEGMVDDSWHEMLAWFLGVPVGTWLLYFGFVLLAGFTRRKMSAVWKARLNILIGIIFLCMAAYIGVGALLGKHKQKDSSTQNPDPTTQSGSFLPIPSVSTDSAASWG